MAAPSSPTRRQTGFQLPDSKQISNANISNMNSNSNSQEIDFSTRSRNDTQDTITQAQHNDTNNQGIISQLQPFPIPGTIYNNPSATRHQNHQSSQSPSDLPTPPDTETNLNLSIRPSSTSSQPSLVTREDEILKPNQMLSSVISTHRPPGLPIQQQRYPSSIASSGPGSLSSSAGATSALNATSIDNNKNFSSLSHNYSTSNHSNPHSQPRNSLGFSYSPYSTKSSGFKTSAERGVPRDREIEGTPERDSSTVNNNSSSESSRVVEGVRTGDSAGVFSFSSPYFGPQSVPDEDIHLEQEGGTSSLAGPSRSQLGDEMKSPGWAAITLGQLSLGGSPDVPSFLNQGGGSIPKSSAMMASSSSQGGIGASLSSSSARRYPPSSSSTSISTRPNSSRMHSHSHHGPSSFNSGSPASRSLPSADAAIHAAAMHRRASYNRTASGAQRPSLIQNGHHHHSALGLSPASPSPIGMAAHGSATAGGRSRHSGGAGGRKSERSRSRSRYTSRGRNVGSTNRDGEFDEDATDDDEMVLDINDKDHNHLVDDDDDTEDELLDQDHSGSIAGSNFESSVIGDMDTDLEMDESEMGSNYGGDKRMKDSNVKGWDIYSRDGSSNASRSLSGYYTSTRGEYVSSPNNANSKNGSNQNGIGMARPYLLDRVNRSSSSGASPSLGLSLNQGLGSPRSISGGNSGTGSSSFGTSPSSFGRHHPYASTSRSSSSFGGGGNQSASPSRSIGNQSGMQIRSSSSINHDLEDHSHSLPTRIGIGVSPLGKSSGLSESKNTVSNERRRNGNDDERMGNQDEHDDDTEDEIFDDNVEEDLRNKVKGLTVGSHNDNNKTISSRPVRKSSSIRRASFKDSQSDQDHQFSSSLTNKSTATLKDLESIISSSPKRTSSTTTSSGASPASISAAGIREKLGGSSNCSAFISKLWHLMSNPEKYQDYITWSTNGDSIILFNDQEKQDVFAKEILPKLFKHGNVASFVRQLNLYGFQRVPTTRSLDSAEQELAISQANNSLASSSNPNSRGRAKLSSIATNAGAFYGSHSAFVHPNFMRGGEDKLSSMKPRSSKGKKGKDGDIVGDISTSPSNVSSMIGNGERKSKSSKVGKVDPSKMIVNHQQEEETDDEDDLAFD